MWPKADERHTVVRPTAAMFRRCAQPLRSRPSEHAGREAGKKSGSVAPATADPVLPTEWIVRGDRPMSKKRVFWPVFVKGAVHQSAR
jgi:hypothetical protein